VSELSRSEAVSPQLTVMMVLATDPEADSAVADHPIRFLF